MYISSLGTDQREGRCKIYIIHTHTYIYIYIIKLAFTEYLKANKINCKTASVRGISKQEIVKQ